MGGSQSVRLGFKPCFLVAWAVCPKLSASALVSAVISALIPAAELGVQRTSCSPAVEETCLRQLVGVGSASPT